ncbi:hypothetical protein U0070_023162, partial [Myodes glareolus]
RSKDKFAVKELWESSGRNLGKLLRGLTDECLKPPVMVHVSMQGQEALFSGNMTLKEVIKHLNEQQSTTESPLENEITPLPISGDTLLTTGSKVGQNYPWNTSEENGGVSSPRNKMDSLFTIQTDWFSKADEGAVSDEIPLDLRTHQDTARYHEESQSAASSGDVPMVEVQSGISSRPAQTEDFQNHAANCTCDSTRDSTETQTNTNKVHKKERSFVCTMCHKDFYTHSDLTVHEIIYKEKKPFKCPICERLFSHKTNLLAHKRIHTGKSPIPAPSVTTATANRPHTTI